MVRLIGRQSVLMESSHHAIVNEEGGFGNGRSLDHVQAEYSEISEGVKGVSYMVYTCLI